MEWIASQGSATLPLAAHGTVGYCQVPRLKLHHGGELEDVRLCYEITGQPHGKVVLVLGGISASRHICATPANAGKGWWEPIVGSERAIDTNQFRVLGFDYLGGNGETTGPKEAGSFPAISTYDQAECLARVMDHLGIDRLHALVGSSYGGMVGLAFAARYPSRIDKLTVISAGNKTPVMSTAWRTLQRNIIKLGIEQGATDEAVCLSRGLAMTTYRSPVEFEERFDGPPRETDKGLSFPIEDYLTARGNAFAETFNPLAFLCLSESIDLHKVDMSQITVPTTLVSVVSDLLVPPQLMRAMANQLAAYGQLHEIDSLYGHDAFLKEIEQLTPIITQALAHAQD